MNNLRKSSRTVDQSRQSRRLWPMARIGEPIGNCSVSPFLAEISQGVEDRRPGPTPQVGIPNLAKDRVNTMSTSPKVPSLQAYQLALYRGPLHPEFFRVATRKTLLHNGYEAEAWLFPGGHTARFEFGPSCATEVLSEEVDTLPVRGVIASLPCAGEREHECKAAEKVDYMTSVQTETLEPHLYRSTFLEMLEYAESPDCIHHRWRDEEGENLSVLELQRYNDELHLQTWHLRADNGLVLRSQSVFMIKD